MFVSSKTNLMLVHSEPVLAELTSFRLELLGYGIKVFRSAGEALGEIAKELPDLVIVDTTLIDGDGLDWLTRLRGEFTVTQLPVLVISHDPTLETVERAFAAGAQDYILTPYDPTVLEEKIERLTSSRVRTH